MFAEKSRYNAPGKEITERDEQSFVVWLEVLQRNRGRCKDVPAGALTYTEAIRTGRL